MHANKSVKPFCRARWPVELYSVLMITAAFDYRMCVRAN